VFSLTCVYPLLAMKGENYVFCITKACGRAVHISLEEYWNANVDF
jgi:hypothetical protein